VYKLQFFTFIIIISTCNRATDFKCKWMPTVRVLTKNSVPTLDNWWPSSEEVSPPLLPTPHSLFSSFPSLTLFSPSSPPLEVGPSLQLGVYAAGQQTFWHMLGVNLSLFGCLTMKHLLCHYFQVVENQIAKIVWKMAPPKICIWTLFGWTPQTCLMLALKKIEADHSSKEWNCYIHRDTYGRIELLIALSPASPTDGAG